jgi:signal transduction histidine kinase
MESGGDVDINILEDQETVRVAVRDHGTGIPSHLRETIFNPFFTTKPKGTGLGLPITHRIVTEHGGTLEFGPAPGGGTTFLMVFPKSSHRRVAHASTDR